MSTISLFYILTDIRYLFHYSIWSIFGKNMRTLSKPMEVLLVPPPATPTGPNSSEYFCQNAPALEVSTPNGVCWTLELMKHAAMNGCSMPKRIQYKRELAES